MFYSLSSVCCHVPILDRTVLDSLALNHILFIFGKKRSLLSMGLWNLCLRISAFSFFNVYECLRKDIMMVNCPIFLMVLKNKKHKIKIKIKVTIDSITVLII